VPLQKLQFRPGVNREGTSLSNEGGWFDCDKVRFRSGYPEKIGGWAALSYTTFLGVCRSLWNWVTLKNFNILGVGTSLKFYVENGEEYYDITPIRETNTNPSNQITLAIANGSSVLTITDANAESLQVNDFVTLVGAVDLGSAGTNVTAAVLNQEYQIVSVLSGTQYTVTLRSAVPGDIATTNGGATLVSNRTASSSTMTGLTIAYQISTGANIFTTGTGWGAGPWAPFLFDTLTDPFATTNTSTTITVTQASHGLTTGQYVYFASISDTSVGGIPNTTSPLDTPLIRAFQITNTGTNTYTIISPVAATATDATAGGTVVVYYPSITLGTASSARGWGTAYTLDPVIGLQLRLWSQANFGQILLFNPRGFALYSWDPGAGATPSFGTRGTAVTGTDVPSQINQILVSDVARITIAFGCSEYGAYGTADFDPLLIRWTAQEDYTNWTPAITNQAGDTRLSNGSEIVGALQTRQEILVWTNAAIYSMQYLGPPLVYGFTLLSDNISIVSPNAMATAAGVVYWMGVDKFYVYSGRVETLPCSVRQFIFNDINRDQEAQFNAGTSEGYSEIWWNYCSKNSDVIDRYVIFNYLDRVWYYGTLDRTAWLDSPLRQYPMAATSGNIIVYHEAAVDDGSTNPPSPINAYIQSSDFDIEDGHNYGFVWRIIPDITFDGSNTNGETSVNPYVQFTVRPKQNPGSGYGTALSPTVQSAQNYAGQTTYNVQQFTEIIYSRVRGRQMAFKVESNSLGTQWQLGVPRIDVRPDGRN
jgi:hypothetical protein